METRFNWKSFCKQVNRIIVAKKKHKKKANRELAEEAGI